MKITATPKVSYMVKIGEIEFQAEVVSEWEGLTKLDTEHGTMIVAGLKPRPGLQGEFDEIFRGIFDGGAHQLVVHMASHKIIEYMRTLQPKESAESSQP